MKEYWVNVYDGWISFPYEDKVKCVEWNRVAYRSKQVLYRIHVKLKEPKPKYETTYYYRSYGQAEV